MASKLKAATRMELLNLKKKVKLATKGHKLLKEKRDALVSAFFKHIEELKGIRTEVEEKLKIAYESLLLAQATSGRRAISVAAGSSSASGKLVSSQNNIMGVKVPKIETSEIQKAFMDRGYGVYNSSAIDEAAAAYEKVMEKILLAAEVETSMRKLLNEIEKTKRRVNALEFVVLPRLEETTSFIRLRLEEMERENIFRLKRIKAKVQVQ